MARPPDHRSHVARRRLVGSLPAMTAVALACVGWWYLVHDVEGAHTGAELAWVAGGFAGYALVSSLRRCLDRPDGFGGQVAAMRALRNRSSKGAAGAWALPRWRSWLLPWALLPLFALALPVAFRESPGDNSIVGVMVAVALVGATAGLGAGVLAWMTVLLPFALLARLAWFALRGRPVDDDLRFAAALGALVFSVVVLATGLVAARPPGAGSTASADRAGQLAAFLGAGDQSSPWLWVARTAALGAVAAAVALRHTVKRERRERREQRATTPTTGRPGPSHTSH